jgi:hypothetical protein
VPLTAISAAAGISRSTLVRRVAACAGQGGTCGRCRPAPIGAWLTEEIQAGRIRQLPLPLLVQLLSGPMIFHMMTRPAFATLFGHPFRPSSRPVTCSPTPLCES